MVRCSTCFDTRATVGETAARKASDLWSTRLRHTPRPSSGPVVTGPPPFSIKRRGRKPLGTNGCADPGGHGRNVRQFKDRRRTGIRHARHELVVLADDDVRHDATTVTQLLDLVPGADVVRP